LGDFAILFRTQVQPRLFEMHLRERHIPYRLVGGMSFFDRKEVRDILAYLRLVANPADELSLLRVINTPPRGIGSTTVRRAMATAAAHQCSLAEVFRREETARDLTSGAVESARGFFGILDQLRGQAKTGDLPSLVKTLIARVQYADEIARCYPEQGARTARWEAIQEIVNMAEIHARQDPKSGLGEFLESLTLSARDDDEETDGGDDDKVTLMTLHAAKGLEFRQVYLVGMEEGLLPHARSVQDGALEEERRLAYVGVTRAKRGLTLTYAASRARYGTRTATVPSRFLYELKGMEPPLDRMEALRKQQAEEPPKAGGKRARKKRRVSGKGRTRGRRSVAG
jgi:DNA helicase-2/ATP-dependent DNA helicase PcrA